jgi:hypothetical protein
MVPTKIGGIFDIRDSGIIVPRLAQPDRIKLVAGATRRGYPWLAEVRSDNSSTRRGRFCTGKIVLPREESITREKCLARIRTAAEQGLFPGLQQGLWLEHCLKLRLDHRGPFTAKQMRFFKNALDHRFIALLGLVVSDGREIVAVPALVQKFDCHFVPASLVMHWLIGLVLPVE